MLSQAYNQHITEWASPDVWYWTTVFPPRPLSNPFRQLLWLRFSRGNKGDEVSGSCYYRTA